MDRPILVIIFIIVVIGILIYFISNAPEIFKAVPRERTLFSRPASTSYFSGYGSQTGSQSYGTSGYSSGQTSSGYAETIPDYLIPEGLTWADLSPYFNKVRISSAYYSYFAGSPSEIRLYAYLPQGEKVNVSGWRIKSNRRELTIPQAIEVYESTGLSPEGDIVISGNASLTIYSNVSPLGKNLRLNRCIGYLENVQKLTSIFPPNCPAPYSQGEIAALSGTCQSYILSLGSCRLPDVSLYNSFPGTDEGNLCRQFLSRINYGSCYSKYRFDADFLSGEWRIWVNENILLDQEHDRLRLFDKQGLLVSQYSY